MQASPAQVRRQASPAQVRRQASPAQEEEDINASEREWVSEQAWRDRREEWGLSELEMYDGYTRHLQEFPPPPGISMQSRRRRSEVEQARQAINSSPSPARQKKIKEFINKIASRKIHNFFKKTEIPRKANFLSSLCSDSGQCIGMGLEVDKIKKFFNNFNFDFVEFDKIKRIGSVSANGFINEIPYKRNKYTAYAILKSSIKKSSDNLFYEGFVGNFINKLNTHFPCFLETYSVFKYTKNNYNIYNDLKNNRPITAASMSNLTHIADVNSYNVFLNDTNVNISCKESQFHSILIQHIKDSKTLDQYMNQLTVKEFFTLDLVSYLYQIYSCLGMLSDVLTHYDLHTGNVMIYNISKNNKYIKMVYHYRNDETVEFFTNSLVKIIDYGRCYFNDVNENVSSKDIWKIITDKKKTPECNPPRGKPYGYHTLKEEIPEGSYHYISSQKRNKSHDLRLAAIIAIIARIPGKNNNSAESVFIREIINSVYKTYIGEYGTKEVDISDYATSGIIRNVEDMHLALKNLIQNVPYFKNDNKEFFKDKVQMGELHTWLDRSKPIEYKPSSYQYFA